ncbi:hypothetical protein QQX98_006059 [Neonectria punicea]|uniref:GH16 domain-containing protein n=1 Tax=Neonectria punicea TaxID=979145 RepID=A0ABR1H2A5_9HYPO
MVKRDSYLPKMEEGSGSSSNSPDISPVRSRSPVAEALARLEKSRDSVSVNDGAVTSQIGVIPTSRPPSSFGSSKSNTTAATRPSAPVQAYFHSRRVKPGEIEKPWLDKTDPKEKWVTILPIMAIGIGLLLSGFLIWDGLRSVVHHKYCPVMDETFDSDLDPTIWTKEVELGGYGNGEFQQTTGGNDNVYVENGQLVIKATLQDASLMEKNNVINLLKDGTCTSKSFKNCVAATNTTAGNASVVPPTKSGRVNTKKGASITYGRVEVTAKLPEGDWLWPAIWMLPVDNAYGSWPRSGEIDIVESRGNNYTYAQGGNNIVSSALHWGPNPANDAWYKTNKKRQALHTTYSAGFNTFGMEWSQKYFFTFINNRLLQITYTNFNKPMWKRGGFPDVETNGTRLVDPWTPTGENNAPFNKPFYLVMDLAVGGTNGWFEDLKSGKPWVDDSPSAKKDFWGARDEWYPTWKSPTLEVSRVVMSQQCDGDEGL